MSDWSNVATLLMLRNDRNTGMTLHGWVYKYSVSLTALLRASEMKTLKHNTDYVSTYKVTLGAFA